MRLPDIEKIQQYLPAYMGTVKLVNPDQTTSEIVTEILKAHKDCAVDYEQIAPFFWTNNVYTTCGLLFDFCKKNLKYKAEPDSRQTVKTPAAILAENTVDCKHYASFIGGVLSAINRIYGADIEWWYRFASYTNSKTPGHVFVVVDYMGYELWVDPVLDYMDQRKNPNYYTDKKINDMALVRISGTDSKSNVGVIPISVNSKAAYESFLIMVNQNVAGLKDLLKSDKTALYGAVKQFFLANNLDFNQLLLILQS
jgi:hypothetical protein